ncbi:MAG: hypothetical protein EPN64_06105 [Burkholderiaceae bacterium]|nr:MAG: hypothetical protein EPN64_06105 [Burkholderiaceae bacterium]
MDKDSTLNLPSGTFDTQLAKVIFPDRVGHWSLQQQADRSKWLIEWLERASADAIERHSQRIDQQLVCHLHGAALRQVCHWFSVNPHALHIGMRMPTIERAWQYMSRSILYNQMYQQAPLERVLRAIEADNRATGKFGAGAAKAGG